MTDHIAGPIDQVEHLPGIGQGDNQRRIAPDPFIGKSNASFALSQSRSNRAIGINKGLGKKTPRLLFPDPLPSAVDGFHQIRNGLLVKASGKIPLVVGSGMRWAPRPSRNVSSLRRNSISSSRWPSKSAL